MGFVSGGQRTQIMFNCNEFIIYEGDGEWKANIDFGYI